MRRQLYYCVRFMILLALFSFCGLASSSNRWSKTGTTDIILKRHADGKRQSADQLSKNKQNPKYFRARGRNQQRGWYFDGLTCKSYVEGINARHESFGYCLKQLHTFYKTIDVVLTKKDNKSCVVYSSQGGNMRNQRKEITCSTIPANRVYYLKSSTKCGLKIGNQSFERPMPECYYEKSKSKKKYSTVPVGLQTKKPDFYFFNKSQCMVLRNDVGRNSFIESTTLDQCLQAFSENGELAMHVNMMKKTSRLCRVFEYAGKRRLLSAMSCAKLKDSGDVYYVWTDGYCSMVIPDKDNWRTIIERDDHECNIAYRSIYIYDPTMEKCLTKTFTRAAKRSLQAFRTLKECEDHAAGVKMNKDKFTIRCIRYCDTAQVRCREEDCQVGKEDPNCKILEPGEKFVDIKQVSSPAYRIDLAPGFWGAASRYKKTTPEACLKDENCTVCPSDMYFIGVLPDDYSDQ